MADETKRVIDQTTDSSLSAGDFIIVDSQSEGTRKFDLGTELTDIKQDLQAIEESIVVDPTNSRATTLDALIKLMYFTDQDVSTSPEYIAFANAWGLNEMHLTSILLTLSTNQAEVGTETSTLISSVIGTYSDAFGHTTTAPLTNYTVSPSTISSGTNNVSVSYGDITSNIVTVMSITPSIVIIDGVEYDISEFAEYNYKFIMDIGGSKYIYYNDVPLYLYTGYKEAMPKTTSHNTYRSKYENDAWSEPTTMNNDSMTTITTINNMEYGYFSNSSNRTLNQFKWSSYDIHEITSSGEGDVLVPASEEKELTSIALTLTSTQTAAGTSTSSLVSSVIGTYTDSHGNTETSSISEYTLSPSTISEGANTVYVTVGNITSNEIIVTGINDVVIIDGVSYDISEFYDYDYKYIIDIGGSKYIYCCDAPLYLYTGYKEAMPRSAPDTYRSKYENDAWSTPAKMNNTGMTTIATINDISYGYYSNSSNRTLDQFKWSNYDIHQITYSGEGSILVPASE